MENRVGTGGGESLDDKADIKIQRISDSNLTNRASRELVEMWRLGSQDAARVLLARYEVRWADRAILRDEFGWQVADSCGKFSKVCYDVGALHF